MIIENQGKQTNVFVDCQLLSTSTTISTSRCDAPMVHVSNADANGNRILYVSCWIKVNGPSGTNPFNSPTLQSVAIPNKKVVNVENTSGLTGTGIEFSYTPNSDNYHLWFFAYKYPQTSGLGVQYITLKSLDDEAETERGTVTTPEDDDSET